MSCGGWSAADGLLGAHRCRVMLPDGTIANTGDTAGKAFGAFPNILEIQGDIYLTGYANALYAYWATATGASIDVMKLDQSDLSWTLIKRQAPAFDDIRFSLCVVVRETIILYIFN